MGLLSLLLLLVLIALVALQRNAQPDNFYTYYSPTWGQNHITVNPQGTEAKLLIDQYSGGAGFRSKVSYGSGLFHVKMKIPYQKTGGILTTFYLTSVAAGDQTSGQNHFEMDFEFFGTGGVLSTNIFNDDSGNREQQFRLWFDPSQDFHNYDILWNPNQILFLIDNIPIRVFKNSSAQGVVYPWRPLHIEASLWNASWAGDTNWGLGPFTSYLSDFMFDACSVPDGTRDVSACASDQFPWNNWELTDTQKNQLKEYRAKYMVHDYCTRTPSPPEEDDRHKLECFLNN